MAEVDRALKQVQAAAKRYRQAEADQVLAKSALHQALRDAQDARATWKEMLEASGISQPTLAKALRRQ